MHCWGERACIRSLLWIRLWVLNTSMAKFPEENFNSSKYLYKEKGGQWLNYSFQGHCQKSRSSVWVVEEGKKVTEPFNYSSSVKLCQKLRSQPLDDGNQMFSMEDCLWLEREKSLGKLKPRGSFPTQLSSQKMAEKLLPTLPKALGWMRSICFKIDFHEP